MTESNRPDKSISFRQSNQQLTLILSNSGLRCPYPIQRLSRFLFRGFRDDFLLYASPNRSEGECDQRCQRFRPLFEANLGAISLPRIWRYLRLRYSSTFFFIDFGAKFRLPRFLISHCLGNPKILEALWLVNDFFEVVWVECHLHSILLIFIIATKLKKIQEY